MPRYLFNFIGDQGRTFSDAVEQREYHTPEVLQRTKLTVDARLIATAPDKAESIVVENYRRIPFRGPKHRSWDKDDVWYVHPAISDERALEIVSAILSK